MSIIRRSILALALMAGLGPVFAQAPAPVPALPDTERRTSYSISASVCGCAIGFQLYGDSTDVANWLRVFVNGVELTQSGNWSITSPSGQVASLARPISDAVLTFTAAQTGTVQIVGAQRPRRLTEVSENRGVAARDFNQFANTVTAELRELWDRFTRTPQVPPGEITPTLPPLASRANMGVCFDTNGYLAPCVSVPSGSFTAGSNITFTGTNPTSIAATSYSPGNGISFTGSNPVVISVNASTGVPVFASRSIATGLDLHTYSVIQTGGYGAGGDGGSAAFKNIGSGDFIDSFITSFTITGGSGYTNAGYFGVVWVSGTKPFAIGTATVSGGAITAVSVAGTPGGLCHVGDVYTTGTIPGGVSGSITITGCSTPRGSFTDSVGTHFQIVNSEFPNIKQFGAIGDWLGTDFSATDNFNAIQAALWYGSYMNQLNSGNGGFWGNKVFVPQGTYLACGGGSTPLIVPMGVTIEGASNQASVIRRCDAFNSTTNFVDLCDPNWHFTCFNAKTNHIQLSTRQSVSGGAFMIYSDATQDMGGVYDTYVYSGGQGCVWFRTGYGGASVMTIEDISCNGNSAGPMIQIGDTVASGLNLGSTAVYLKKILLGGPSSGPPFQTGPGVSLLGGHTTLLVAHCEQMPKCVLVNLPTDSNNLTASLQNVNAGANVVSCTGAVSFAVTNRNNNTVLTQIIPGSCTHVVENGQSGGANYDLEILTPARFNPSFTQP